MFSCMNKQGVPSTEGFEVQFTGRFTVEYREGPRHLVVDIESGGNGLINFNAMAFEKWANASMINSRADQARTRKNFMAALEFQGLVGIP